MKLYQKLVNDFAPEIKKVKQLKQQYDATLAKMNDVYNNATSNSDMSYEEAYNTVQTYASEVNGLYNAYMSSYADLSEEIDIAYSDVPFRKTAEQGRTAFFKLADI